MRTLNQNGGPAPLHKLLTDLGFTTLTRTPAEYGLGLTIGNAEVTLAELTNGFATLARLGDHHPIRITQDPQTPSPLITDNSSLITAAPAAYLINHILSDNTARADAFGHRFIRPPAPGTPHTAIELCNNDRFPLPVSPHDYNPDGLAILDTSYEEWFTSPDNLRRSDFILASETVVELTTHIITPAYGSTYLLDPELPTRGQRLKLLSNVTDDVTWECDTLTLENDTALLTPGTHVITLHHPPTSQTVKRRFTVESL